MKIRLTAIYDQDSRRYHRYLIKQRNGVTGSIYVEKGKEIPETVIIDLETQGNEREQKRILRRTDSAVG